MSREKAVTPNDPIGQHFPDLNDFSLILGGPLYQLWQKAHLGDVEASLRRRILILSGICWLPLLALCAVGGTLWQGVAVPFLLDVETHVRFLLCVALLVFAETIVHRRIRGIVAQFIERGLIPPGQLPRFYEAIHSAMVWRNSISVEIGILLLVFSIGNFVRVNTLVLQAPTWYATMSDGAVEFTLSGGWYFWVSTPIFQFLLLRWFYRIFVWSRLLWQISRLNLALIPTHPDRNCGLGFLSGSAYAFSPLLAALGAALAGFIANRIFYDGAVLTEYKAEIVMLGAIGLLLVLAPSFAFIPQIVAAKRLGLYEYGALASEYTRSFDQRWLRSADRDGEPLLGAADIQSLADLGNAYTVIKEIKLLPFSRDMLLQLVMATVLPFFPLLFTLFPFEVMLDRLVGVIF